MSEKMRRLKKYVILGINNIGWNGRSKRDARSKSDEKSRLALAKNAFLKNNN